MPIVAFLDAYPISRFGFRQMLQNGAPNVLGLGAASVDELAVLASEHALDLLIITVNTIRQPDPLSLVQECKRRYPDLPIVLYDEEHYASYAERWLKLGVSGYLLKREPAAVMIQCIEMVVNGGKYLSPEGWSRYLTPSFSVLPKENAGKLAAGEFEVARHLSCGKSVKWIAETLGKQPSTISNVKRRIFHKLKIDNIIELNSILGTVSGAGKKGDPRTLNSPSVPGPHSRVMR